MQYYKYFQKKHIIRKISQYIDIHPTPIILGRWTVERCNRKIDNKIEMANEDHCGPCGQQGPVKWPQKSN